MIRLTGNSLNKRHQELNSKVNEAINNKLSFEEILCKNESSDVDKLFKIDLAVKYKNIDYILEILKSGDSLYISRALRCDWITNDEFENFINPQYLESHIFPYMSLKMKKKLLSTLSTRLRNANRAEAFYHYCMRNQMLNIGMNFLLYTHESFKIDYLLQHEQLYNHFDKNKKYLENYIGNSFKLAENYLKGVSDYARSQVFYNLRYLFSVSEEQYLDLVETFYCPELMNIHNASLKLSRAIMKKHKSRVLKNPRLYLVMLNHGVVTKYSKSDDAKVYALAFLPNTHSEFWLRNYYEENKFFLDLIPLDERFSFIKNIFTEKYHSDFEDDFTFFHFKFYEMMTAREKEEWALRQIASGNELHGCGNDYIWYQFVNFEKSFTELKNYILITADKDKRLNILNTLINSAKTQKELNTLLEYYYNRHINELAEYKRSFLNMVIDTHKVLNFNEECWASLEKIFHSLDVYQQNCQESNDYQNKQYRVLSLTYYIVHKKPVPDVINGYVIKHNITRWDFGYDLNPEWLEMIYQYLLTCYRDHVESLLKSRGFRIHEDTNLFIHIVLDLLAGFNKTIEDIPEIINKYMKLDFTHFSNHKIFDTFNKPSAAFQLENIKKFLKEDASLVISEFNTIRKYFEEKLPKRNINWLIRKLKVYFSHDIAQEYIKLLDKCLSVEELHLQTARVAVFGIFNLSDEEYKIKFLKKYVPKSPKIDHVKIDRNHLTIQTAICSIACQARPPLPMSSFRDYITGDYLKFCIPIFNSYLVNLMPDQCISFVESLLDSPVSVQKHALRLAFQCFSSENLKSLVLKVWEKTKNVSLRKVLYKALFDKVNCCQENLVVQGELFRTLTIMTHGLQQDDNEKIFLYLSSVLPPSVFGQHLQSGYTVVSSFPKRKINYQRLTRILHAMTNNIELISKHVLLGIVEDHMNSMLDPKLIVKSGSKKGYEEVINAKWSLFIQVIIEHRNSEIICLVSDKCLDKWHATHNNEYIYRKFWMDMVNDLENVSYRAKRKDYLETNNVFETILSKMENLLQAKEIYLTVWKLKVNILTRQFLATSVQNIEPGQDVETVNALVKTIILKFCAQITNFVKEFVDKKQFYSSFYNEIIGLLREVTSRLRDGIYESLTGNMIDDVNIIDIDTLLCSTLLKIDDRSLHVFLMHLILSHYNGVYLAEYQDVINKLKSLEDEEVQYYLCHKFFSSDYEYRNFMP